MAKQKGTVVVKADQALAATLRDFKKKSTINAILRPGVRASTRVVAKGAKKNAPRKTGALKKALTHRVKTMKGKAAGVVGLVVTKGGGKVNFYAKPLELGGQVYGTRKTAKGWNRGLMPKVEYAKRAIMANESKVKSIMQQQTEASLAKQAAKLRSKNKAKG